MVVDRPKYASWSMVRKVEWCANSISINEVCNLATKYQTTTSTLYSEHPGTKLSADKCKFNRSDV
jgi:hypothetical protein